MPAPFGGPQQLLETDMTRDSTTQNTAPDTRSTERRRVLKQIGGLAATTLAPGLAWAQANDKFMLKIAISLPDSHPTPSALKAACAEILKESKGRLAIEVYPNGQLGSDTDTVSQVRSGAID